MWCFDCRDHWYGGSVIDGKDVSNSGQDHPEVVDPKNDTMG